MIDPQTVDVAVGEQRQQQTVGRLEHVGVLLPQAGELVDIEEPPVAAGDRVDVEELLATLGIGPVGVALVRGHVVGNDIEDDSQPGVARRLGQMPELPAAAEIIGQPRGIDHVIAVPGAGTRLERGGQVEVRDAEVTQVGDKRASRCKAELRGQLQPVRRPELNLAGGRLRRAQATRLRIRIDREMTLTRSGRRTRRCPAARPDRRWRARAPIASRTGGGGAGTRDPRNAR